MACVMACYQPTRNCYSFCLNFIVKNCDTPIGLQGYTFANANGDFARDGFVIQQ